MTVHWKQHPGAFAGIPSRDQGPPAPTPRLGDPAQTLLNFAEARLRAIRDEALLSEDPYAAAHEIIDTVDDTITQITNATPCGGFPATERP